MDLAEVTHSFAEAASQVVDWMSAHPVDTAVWTVIVAFGAACVIMEYKEYRELCARSKASEERIAKINPGVFRREDFEC